MLQSRHPASVGELDRLRVTTSKGNLLVVFVRPIDAEVDRLGCVEVTSVGDSGVDNDITAVRHGCRTVSVVDADAKVGRLIDRKRRVCGIVVARDCCFSLATLRR